MLTKRTSLIPILFVLLLSAACATTSQPIPGAVDDQTLETNVRNKISEALPGTTTFAVEVKVTSGVVTLNGRTRSEDDRRAIGEAANSVRGVRSVINNISIEP